MEILDRLESAVEILLVQNHQLKLKVDLLQAEQEAWQKERNHLVAEIDRILERLDSAQLEES